MQYTLKTLLVLFVVLATSLAAFGPFGIAATFVGVMLGILAASKQPSGKTEFHAWVAALRHGVHVLKTHRGVQIKLAAVLLLIVVVVTILLLPGLQSHRTISSTTIPCQFNLKQLGLALLNYQEHHGCLPPAYVTDQQGNRLHSWRTLILPYIEEGNLSANYNFNEPWDGPNNRNLAGNALMVLRCDKAKGNDPTRTSYIAVTGPGTAWPGEKSTRTDDFADGLANTILLVELADSDIHWMEPRDLTLEEALGEVGETSQVPTSHHTTETNYFYRTRPLAGWVMMADGSVHCLPRRLSRDDLAALLTINDGKPVDRDRLLERYEPSLVESLSWEHCIGLPLFLISLVWFWIRLVRDASLAGSPEHPREGSPVRDSASAKSSV